MRTMVNPIKNSVPNFSKSAAPKKKPSREIDVRVKKAVKSKTSPNEKTNSALKASSKIATEKANLTAEKAAYAARHRAFEIKKAAVKAQKSAFLAERARLAQQAAALRRARAAEKAKKAARKAAKKALTVRKLAKIKAYLARPDEKKRNKLLKKYIPTSSAKKKTLKDWLKKIGI